MERSNEDLDSCNSYTSGKDPLRFNFRVLDPNSKQVSYLTNLSLAKHSEEIKPQELLFKYNLEKPRRQRTASRRKDSPFTETKTPSTKAQQENRSINPSKIPFLPLLSIRTNALEELYKEIKDLKNNVTEQEEKNKVNAQCIEMNKLRITHMEEKVAKLLRKTGVGCSYEERKEDIADKMKIINADWKNSVGKLQEQVKELEDVAKELQIKSESMRGKLQREGNQDKSFKKTLGHSDSNAKNGNRSCDLLINVTRVKSLIQTPSCNSLYHV